METCDGEAGSTGIQDRSIGHQQGDSPADGRWGMGLPAATATSAVRRLIDAGLEVTVVGSFSSIGPSIRRRIDRWAPPPAAEGRTVLVTGATSGLGLATANELARLGATVCLVGRDRERTAAARRGASSLGRAQVLSETANLGDLEQVKALFVRLTGRLDRLDAVIHNAGVLFHTRQLSPQGTEATATIHLLAPFVLTEGLQPLLRASAPSRVITMTSGGMYAQRFDLEQLVAPSGEYDGVKAYACAKRAQVVLTHEWQRRHGPGGIDFHVVHPGWVDTPGLSHGLPGFARLLRPILRSPPDGADTAVWLAGGRPGQPPGGQLWLDRRPRGEYRLPWTWMPSACRVAGGEALWAWCHAQAAEVVGGGAAR